MAEETSNPDVIEMVRMLVDFTFVHSDLMLEINAAKEDFMNHDFSKETSVTTTAFLYFIGSSADGMPPIVCSDLDTLITEKFHPYVYWPEHHDHIPDAHVKHGVVIAHDFPGEQGCVKLKKLDESTLSDQFMKDCYSTDKDGFLKYDKFINSDFVNNATKTEGPARTGSLIPGHPLSPPRDVTPSMRCCLWPPFAEEFLTRNRMYKWPSSETVDCVKNLGCNVIILPGDDTSLWRITFALGEKHLVRSLCKPILKAMFILKTLKIGMKSIDSSSALVDEGKPTKFCGFFIKMACFWVQEENGVHAFVNEKLGFEKVIQAVCEIIDFLIGSYKNGSLPHFIMRSVNLISKLDAKMCLKVVQSLRSVKDNLWRFVLDSFLENRPRLFQTFGDTELNTELRNLQYRKSLVTDGDFQECRKACERFFNKHFGIQSRRIATEFISIPFTQTNIIFTLEELLKDGIQLSEVVDMPEEMCLSLLQNKLEKYNHKNLIKSALYMETGQLYLGFSKHPKIDTRTKNCCISKAKSHYDSMHLLGDGTGNDETVHNLCCDILLANLFHAHKIQEQLTKISTKKIEPKLSELSALMGQKYSNNGKLVVNSILSIQLNFREYVASVLYPHWLDNELLSSLSVHPLATRPPNVMYMNLLPLCYYILARANLYPRELAIRGIDYFLTHVPPGLLSGIHDTALTMKAILQRLLSDGKQINMC